MTLNQMPTLRTRTPRKKAGGQALPRQQFKDLAAFDRRAQLLEVSAQLFAEFGFESTTIRQIADRADFLPGSLYYYFRSKEEILHEIIQGPVAKTSRDNLRISSLNFDAEHRLIANIIARLYRFLKNGAAFTILQNDRKFLSGHGDFEYVEAVKNKSIELLQSTLNDGMQTGLFRKGIDTSLMIGAISRMLSSAASLFRSGDIISMDNSLSYPLDNVVDFYLDCILRMVRTSSRVDDPIPRAICQELMVGD